MVYFEAACFTAQTNDIQLTSFHTKAGGDAKDHPILGRVEKTFVIARISPDEYRLIEAQRREAAAQAASTREAAAS